MKEEKENKKKLSMQEMAASLDDAFFAMVKEFEDKESRIARIEETNFDIDILSSMYKEAKAKEQYENCEAILAVLKKRGVDPDKVI